MEEKRKGAEAGGARLEGGGGVGLLGSLGGSGGPSRDCGFKGEWAGKEKVIFAGKKTYR